MSEARNSGIARSMTSETSGIDVAERGSTNPQALDHHTKRASEHFWRNEFVEKIARPSTHLRAAGEHCSASCYTKYCNDEIQFLRWIPATSVRSVMMACFSADRNHRHVLWACGNGCFYDFAGVFAF